MSFQKAGLKIFNLRTNSGDDADRVSLSFQDRAKIRLNGNRGRSNLTRVSEGIEVVLISQ